MRKLWNFVRRTARAAWTALVSFAKNTVVNAPATAIMVCGVVGATLMIAATPLEVLCTPISFITETMVAPVLATLLMLLLATIAGRTAECGVSA